ncbi:MAG TPA: extracellular solute-binding protein, partial [Limnochordia bacterium]|nr:extracellular solute-binding protein [Limnochordia bacterium]
MRRYSRIGCGLAVGVLAANALLAPAASAAPNVEISFLSWLDPEFLGKYVDFANTCIKTEHPDVTVTGQTTAGTSVNYTSKVVSSLAAGAGPDVYYFNLGNFDPAWIKNGLMLQIDGYLDHDPAFKADLPPALLAAWRYKGALYGLPSTIGQYAVYYNRDQFAAAGLTAPSPDWTMEGEFAGDLRKLAKVDEAGKLSQYGLQLQTSLSGRFMNYVFSNGGRAVDEDVTQAQLDQPAFVDTIGFFKGLLDSNLITTGGTGAAYNKFVAGTTSMLMSGIF